jgi:hypothetical protein
MKILHASLVVLCSCFSEGPSAIRSGDGSTGGGADDSGSSSGTGGPSEISTSIGSGGGSGGSTGGSDGGGSTGDGSTGEGIGSGSDSSGDVSSDGDGGGSTGEGASSSGEPPNYPECLHDPCVPGPQLNPDCDPCVATVCLVDQYCCNSMWDGSCSAIAPEYCDCP